MKVDVLVSVVNKIWRYAGFAHLHDSGADTYPLSVALAIVDVFSFIVSPLLAERGNVVNRELKYLLPMMLTSNPCLLAELRYQHYGSFTPYPVTGGKSLTW